MNLFLFEIFFSVEEEKVEHIEIENLLKTDDLERLRIHGFVCNNFSK
jgi:arginine deiminase